jgi:hypothetical protein
VRNVLLAALSGVHFALFCFFINFITHNKREIHHIGTKIFYWTTAFHRCVLELLPPHGHDGL